MSTRTAAMRQQARGALRWRAVALGVALVASMATGVLAGRLAADETIIVRQGPQTPVVSADADGPARFGRHQP